MSPTPPRAKSIKSTQTFNLRVNASQQTLIDLAAQALGVTRTTFILEAACRAAEMALLDRRLFQITAEQWLAFNEALDAPAVSHPKLTQLLTTTAPWE